ncbi:Peptidase S1 domain-containing protein [Caenorhabditis elegans]|uniref:Peptidase S1 domain-containing protein n=1 Tax=Caenorhabditis elegans TaxID=6239 RepID=Q6AHP9_CAEEL|nr:Peptidase S1 domain-containing protein [Caenorhabditis elegans]CCD61669.1 Peptidase S1 domain-containing protein [Caenorhabditis elegans]|eukprot:NP_001021891.1 TRYpsin-like protease [Caenorhabditis elegans]
MKKRISDGSGSFRNGGNKFSENEFVQHGTGTLVSPWHIVTAAHLIGISEDPLPDCDTGNLREAYFVRDYKNFVAFVNVTCAVPEMCKGLHRKDMFKPLAIKSLYIRKGYVGDGCIDRESFNDIAVFELEEPIEFSKDIFPACLPSAPKIPRIRETGYKLFGYGRDPSDSVLESGKLKSLYSFVAECSDDFPYGGVYCTSAVNRGLSCDGDSGSGVVRTSDTRNVQVLVGVLSAGMPCPELYDTHNRQRQQRRQLTQETDLLVDVSAHVDFFCTCCGMCS